MSISEIPDINLRVLYDFEYKTKDQRKVSITEGEKLFLIKKTNPDWWQVIRTSKERPFYVPAKYVEECSVSAETLERRLTNGNESTDAQSLNYLRPHSYPGSETNGNLSLEHFDKNERYYQPPSATQHFTTTHNEEHIDTKHNPISDINNFESPAEDVKRILFDKRKLWAVEELMFELTQKRDDKPAPEPEPDYENIFQDEDGNIHITDDNSLIEKPFESNVSNELLDTEGNVIGSASLNVLTTSEHADSSGALSKHRSLSQESDKIDLSSNVLQPGSMANVDKTQVQDNRSLTVSSESLDITPFRNVKSSTESLVSVKNPVEFKVPETPISKDARYSIVSLDGVSSVDIGSVHTSRESVSKVGLGLVKQDSVKSDSSSVNNNSRGTYSRVSLVLQDGLKGSKVDLHEVGSLVTGTRESDDVLKSQRVKKGPKIKELSESLEKLAQQIQFGPAVTSEGIQVNWAKKPSRSFEDDIKTELSRSFEEIESTDIDNDIFIDPDERLQTYPNKMFNKMKNKLSYSSSFKTEKEREKSTRKKYLQDSEGFDVRASVSGAVAIVPDFKGVAFNKPQDIDENLLDSKDKIRPMLEVLEKGHQNMSEKKESFFRSRSKSQHMPTASGKASSVKMPSSSHKNSRDNLDVIGEANILLDYKPHDSNPQSFTSNDSKLTKIAIGFQNPSYRPKSNSLDNFHDMHAMHDMLCTDIEQQQKAKKEEATTEEKGDSEKQSRWSQIRQHMRKSTEIDDPKVRNFHKLKTSIENNNDRPSKENITIVPQITIERSDASSKGNVSKVQLGKQKMFQSVHESLKEMDKSVKVGDGIKKSKSTTVVSISEVHKLTASKTSLDDSVLSQRDGSEGNRSRSGSNTSDDAVLNGRENRRRTSLSRNNRVESIKERHQLKLPLRPPSPAPSDLPVKQLGEGWAEYHTPDGRTYYYSSASGEKSWKPPRKTKQSESEDGSSSPVLSLSVPTGWQESLDNESGQACFVHQNGAKWFSSSDIEGRVYFFEENSVESSWTLPDMPTTPTLPSPVAKQTAPLKVAAPDLVGVAGGGKVKQSIASISILLAEKRREEDTALRPLDGRPQNRITKTRSMVLPVYDDKSPTSLVAPNWPHLLDGNMKFLREGPMYRTKITEHGKKVRKSWSQSYVVLTELFLLFFNDAKHAATMKNNSSPVHPPELVRELSGANIEHGDKLSSRKNVFVISTQLGHQTLIQCDSSKMAEQWYHSIQTAIAILPRSENSPLLKLSPEEKKVSRLGRSRSVKIKSKEGSIEDLTASPDERQTKIRARLKKFFVRRPTKESLVKKGIYKDEPMFGRNLSDVISGQATVPVFVARCIEVIESKEENMKADGLYRVSGNLSQVQKIRLQADQNNLTAIDQEEDVHVLTGALKLFFRELKKPLIPFEVFSKALKASSNPNKEKKIQQFRDIVKSLPSHNRNTLQFLLLHLLRVTKYREFNRMHIANVAIVFGPTLMWPEEEELGNMAIDLMQQNFVVECLLQEYDSIFS